VPEISRFLGIVIFMNWGDLPPPHFHARYGAFEISVEIELALSAASFRSGLCVLYWTGLTSTSRS